VQRPVNKNRMISSKYKTLSVNLLIAQYLTLTNNKIEILWYQCLSLLSPHGYK